MKSLKYSFRNWTKFDFAWLIIANITIISLSIYAKDSIIAIISAMCGITCTIFISKQMISNYLFGLINTSLYAYLAYQSTLYGDCMLNALYYIPMQFIGAYLWIRAKKKNTDNSKEFVIKKLDKSGFLTIGISIIICIILYGSWLRNIGDALPFIDSTSTILAIFAMILTTLRYAEQWYLWIVINSISVIMWWITLKSGSGNYATLIQWCLYLLNSIYGCISWNKQAR